MGVLDADIYGFSVPRMLGVTGRPTQVEQMIMPPVAYDVKVISIGMFTPGNTAVVWRGPMLHRALQQFLGDVYWGDLDVLLMDLPPGTGDIAISVAQLVPSSELLVVTTPQIAAREVAERAGSIALQTHQQIVGVVENMSWLDLPDGSRLELFGSGGGQAVADSLAVATGTRVPLIGQVPIDQRVREGGDDGRPVVLYQPDSPAAEALRSVADILARRQASIVGRSLGPDAEPRVGAFRPQPRLRADTALRDHRSARARIAGHATRRLGATQLNGSDAGSRRPDELVIRLMDSRISRSSHRPVDPAAARPAGDFRQPATADESPGLRPISPTRWIVSNTTTLPNHYYDSPFTAVEPASPTSSAPQQRAASYDSTRCATGSALSSRRSSRHSGRCHRPSSSRTASPTCRFATQDQRLLTPVHAVSYGLPLPLASRSRQLRSTTRCCTSRLGRRCTTAGSPAC